MTTAPSAPAPHADEARTLHLSELIKRPVTSRDGEPLGRISDVVVRLRGSELPLVIGGVASVGGRQVFVPMEQVSSFDGEVLQLASARLDLRQFERRPGEVLLRADLLGHRLIDVEAGRLTKAVDVELERRDGEWVLTGVDTHRPRRRLFGRGAREPQQHAFREWDRFEPLIGHSPSAVLRGPFARIRRLKPAQIADLLEEASKAEETEILGQVNANPEESWKRTCSKSWTRITQTRLLGAKILTARSRRFSASRMRADDAADAVAELGQHRRQPVLDLMPAGQRTKVSTLMGFNPTSAGRLMGVDYLALPADVPVTEALDAVRRSDTLQPEALTSVHAVDEEGRLQAVAKLVSLLQADPAPGSVRCPTRTRSGSAQIPTW